MSRKHTSIVLVALVIAVGLGAIVYAVGVRGGADRAGAVVVSQAPSTPTTPDTSDPTGAGVTETPAYETTTAHESIDTTGAEYTATDTSYTSETTWITITKVSTGSGKNTVTYYVADVQLTSGTDLKSAFAEGFERGNVDYTSTIAADNDAILAINGDYCTARDTGVIIRNGVLYQDVPTRMGLAIYEDGTMRVYDETEISAEQLLEDGVWNTYSFGPGLVIDGAIPDGLDETEVEDIGEKHTILGNQPRTGIGIIDTNHFVFIVVDGRDAGYSTGVTLSEFAQIFQDLACTTAYNLDGGGSSAMYFMGELVNNPLGEGKERGISDILYVG
jgi:exopolysaccharide biosynthesis protein